MGDMNSMIWHKTPINWLISRKYTPNEDNIHIIPASRKTNGMKMIGNNIDITLIFPKKIK